MRRFYPSIYAAFCFRNFCSVFTSVLRHWFLRFSLIFTSVLGANLACLEVPAGPPGRSGIDGMDGRDFSDQIRTITGTIYLRDYRPANPKYVSIYLPAGSDSTVILFCGIENENGIYRNWLWDAVVYDEGYRMVVYDFDSSLVGKNYKVQYLP